MTSQTATGAEQFRDVGRAAVAPSPLCARH